MVLGGRLLSTRFALQVGSVMKINTKTGGRDVWTCQPHEFISEVSFAAKKGATEVGHRGLVL
jgi:carotenoid cleavage dioxygenase-like enzyme